jgi:hypothetical protein
VAIVVAGGRSALSRGASLLTNSPAPCSLSSPNSRQSPQSPQVEAAPANTFAIINHNNTQVLHTGSGVYRIEKISGVDGTRDGGAVSSVGAASDFVLRLKQIATGANTTVYQYGGGVNSDPLTDDTHSTIDFLWFYIQGANAWAIFESDIDLLEVSSSGYAWIWRTGTSLGYGRGATLAAAQAAPDRTTTSTGTLYFDSTLWGIGDTIEAAFYQPQDLVGTSSLTFAASATATGNGALVGASALTFAPSATATGLGALSGSSTLIFSPASTLTGKGALSGTSTIIFSPSATLTGKGALSGAGSLTFAPSATLTGPGSAIRGHVTAARQPGRSPERLRSALRLRPRLPALGRSAEQPRLRSARRLR